MKNLRQLAGAALVLIVSWQGLTQELNKTIVTKQWSEDIYFYAKTLKNKHINLFHTISQEQFDAEINELLLSLNELSSHQVIAELIRITQRIGDGHTNISMVNLSKSLPLKLSLFGDKFMVVATNEQYKSLWGKELTHIEEKAISSVVDRIKPYVSGVENQWSFKGQLVKFLIKSDLLKALGIVDDDKEISLTFTDENNDYSIAKVTAISDSDYYENTNWVSSDKTKNEYLTSTDNSQLEYLWYSALPDGKSVYVAFDKYPTMAVMDEFSRSLSLFIEKKNLSRVIIDFRNNGGGDFYVGLKLSQNLLLNESINWINGVYVLIGRKTFSAAMSNAAQYKQILNATLVGQPTGANPVGYQEQGAFILPNSKLNVRYSKRLFRFRDTDTDGLQPDIYIAPPWNSEKQGKDAILDWLMSY